MTFKFIIYFLISTTFNHCQENKPPYVLVAHGFGGYCSTAKFWLKVLYPSSQAYQQRISISLEEINDDQGFDKFEIFHNVYAVEFNDRGNLSQSYLGQGQDIEKIDLLVKQQFNTHAFVGIGHSRGSSALISYVATYNPKGLCTLVLHGTVASMPDVIASKIGGWIGSSIVSKILLKLFSKYPFQQTPQEAIENITNKDLLIILLHHTHDEKVAQSHGKRLYSTFKKNNFKNIYWIPIDKGGHDTHIQEAEYIIINSIYKAYNLPHDVLAAQITIQELKQRFQP